MSTPIEHAALVNADIDGDIDVDIDALGVYQLYTGSGTGSGFLLDATHLLTNCHVVSPYREVAIELRDRNRIVGKVRRLHPHRDLAIVELAQPLDGRVLVLGDGAPVRAKQSVHILGFPVGLPLSLTEGVISHPRQILDEQFYLQTDAAINPGNSGGPILDDERRVVAVTTCKLNSADAVGFGIPIADALEFIHAFSSQEADFGVQCPACVELIAKATRYCPGCGLDLHGRHEFADYFVAPEPHPLVEFVETALTGATIDPVLARHGSQNWSFQHQGASIKVWCCCSEHVNFSSPLAQVGQQNLGDLFRYLLAAEHVPCVYDLNGSAVRLSLVIHIADIFARNEHAELAERVRTFLEKAGSSHGLLIEKYGCLPAPETLADLDAMH
jgi:serine protease Do